MTKEVTSTISFVLQMLTMSDSHSSLSEDVIMLTLIGMKSVVIKYSSCNEINFPVFQDEKGFQLNHLCKS